MIKPKTNRMKKTTIRLSLALLAAGFISLTACVKEGPVGPQGPAGYDGANGAQGATGPTGSVNILNNTIVVTPANWTASTGSSNTTVTGGAYFYDNFNFISSIGSGSAVMIYLQLFNTWIPLSWTNNDQEYSFDYTPTTFQLTLQSASGTTTVPLPTANDTFKVVVIPQALKALHPTVNYKDYKEVKHTFNLNN